MKLHYMGKYNMDADSLPNNIHRDGAVKFKEPDTMAELAKKVNIISIIVMAVVVVPIIIRYRGLSFPDVLLGYGIFMLTLFPHEILHALCFKEDVWLYTNIKQGMLFVVASESVTKARFVFMSLLPNIVFGAVPYIISFFADAPVIAFLGVCGLSAGAGDYYNVYNALTQMPKGAMTYMYKMNSYWYMP